MLFDICAVIGKLLAGQVAGDPFGEDYNEHDNLVGRHFKYSLRGEARKRIVDHETDTLSFRALCCNKCS